MSDPLTIAVLEGDETGQELLEEALRVLDPELLELPLALERFDLSLESRRATRNSVVIDAAAAMRRHGLGLKARRRGATTSAPPTASCARPSAAR